MTQSQRLSTVRKHDLHAVNSQGPKISPFDSPMRYVEGVGNGRTPERIMIRGQQAPRVSAVAVGNQLSHP